MDCRQRLFIYNTRRSLLNSIEVRRLSRFKSLRNLSSHLIGWKQNMKAVRSKCCKIFEKLASISKNTSIPRDRRRQPRSSFVIDDYRQLIVDTKCLRERPQDGYLLHWLAPKYILLLLTYFMCPKDYRQLIVDTKCNMHHAWVNVK